MSGLNVERSRDLLQKFDFQTLFIEELGWELPPSRTQVTLKHDDVAFTLSPLANLGGVAAFKVVADDGRIPNPKVRASIQREIAKTAHENLLLFVDSNLTQSLWYWVKRENGKSYPRDHVFVKGQPGDLFLSKLSGLVVDITELDAQGRIPVAQAARRLKDALDVERVTKKFYGEFKDEHARFLDMIQGIEDARDRAWYASVLLNRLMFIYFLQGKGFLDGRNYEYLGDKLKPYVDSEGPTGEGFFKVFLNALFFEAFAKPIGHRSPESIALTGEIRYLNGGIFLPHPIEQRWPDIRISNQAFEELFALFGRYTWNLNDTPGGKDDEINPDVLGYIFEKYINQKAFGAYYTRPEITDYLCEQTIHRIILDRINTPGIPGVFQSRSFESISELLMNLDAGLCRTLIRDVLPKLTLLDPACGSGAFLVAAMKTLIGIYSAVTGKIDYLTDQGLTQWLKSIRDDHPSLHYYIKKRIILDNLYGVDLMEESIEIAKLRLFLALVASAQTVDQLEPLPNIDFNILAGNSLVGLMQVDEAAFNTGASQAGLFDDEYRFLVDSRNRKIATYRETATYHEDLRQMRDDIEEMKKAAYERMNSILLDEFGKLGLKYEQATWDNVKGKEGQPIRRMLKPSDIEALHPFHWGYEFDFVMNQRGGFDAIITNPPWEVLQQDRKEFMIQGYGLNIEKNAIRPAQWDPIWSHHISQPPVQVSFLSYVSRINLLKSYFKASPSYVGQKAIGVHPENETLS